MKLSISKIRVNIFSSKITCKDIKKCIYGGMVQNQWVILKMNNNAATVLEYNIIV